MPSRRDPVVQRIAHAWRRLTTAGSKAKAGPGERLIVACSGGGDSSALAVALKAAGAEIVLAHVVHDLRPRREALKDAKAVERLSGLLDVPFVSLEVWVKESGENLEGEARRQRYGVLREYAAEEGIGFVATGHNSHDQVESVLMALVRGAGVRGLGGIAEKRKLGMSEVNGQQPTAPSPVLAKPRTSSPAGSGRGPIWLIRPMLGVAPGEARGVCVAAGWEWREDRTNADTSRLRAAVRAKVLPEFLKLRPGVAERVGAAAGASFEAERVVRGLAKKWVGRSEWKREKMRGLKPAVLGCVLRMAAMEAMARSAAGGDARPTQSKKGMDAIGARQVSGAVRLIRSDSTEPKVFEWKGVRVRVTAKTVRVEGA